MSSKTTSSKSTKSLKSSNKSPSFRFPLTYKFNRDNVKKFIAATEPDARDVVTKILKATTHISFETFISYVNKNLDDIVKLLPPGRHIFAYIDKNYQDKSNYWIYVYIKKLAKIKYNITIKVVANDDNCCLRYDDIVLLIDDCIYTGQQMSDIVYQMSVNTKRVHLIIFVPFVSEDAINLITSRKDDNIELKNCDLTFLKYTYKIQPLSAYGVTAAEYSKILQYHPKYYDAEEYVKKYPIYFDHKIADSVSTFPLIYSGFAPNKKNLKTYRLIIRKQNYKKDFNEWIRKQQKLGYQMTGKDTNNKINNIIAKLEQRYEFYPLFSNGDPVPPYKADYDDKIKSKLTNMVIKSLSLTRRDASSSKISSKSLSSSRKFRSV